MLKIAILGSSKEAHDSYNFVTAKTMAAQLSSFGNQIMAAGPNGIASAVAQGVRSVRKTYNCDVQHWLRIRTDFGQSQNFFDPESDEASYCENLHHLIHDPDVWIFFPGGQGTEIQLLAIIHRVGRGEVDLSYKSIIIVGADNRLWGRAREFAAQEGQGVSLIISSNPSTIIKKVMEFNAVVASEIHRVYREHSRGGAIFDERTLNRLVQQAIPQMSYALIERMLRDMARCGDIVLADYQKAVAE